MVLAIRKLWGVNLFNSSSYIICGSAQEQVDTAKVKNEGLKVGIYLVVQKCPICRGRLLYCTPTHTSTSGISELAVSSKQWWVQSGRTYVHLPVHLLRSPFLYLIQWTENLAGPTTRGPQQTLPHTLIHTCLTHARIWETYALTFCIYW